MARGIALAARAGSFGAIMLTRAHLLFVDGSAEEREQVTRALEALGVSVELHVVASEAALERALQALDAPGSGAPDLDQSVAAALRRSETEFRVMFESAAVGILLANTAGRPIKCNPAFQRMLGYTEAELLELAFPAVTHPDDLARDYELYCETIAGKRSHYRIEKRFVRKDRSVMWGRLTVSMVNPADGMSDVAIVMVEDVTEQKRAEEALRQAQRMQSIGTLAGGIAHDFNNILMAIGGNAQLALLDLPDGHAARHSLEEIQHASSRATDLVRRILTFSRRQDTVRKVMALDPVVDEALRLLRATVPAMIQIRTAFASDLPPVLCDATQMHQVVMNLGTNAAHAMKSGGVLLVELDAVRVCRAAQPELELDDGDYLRLRVADTGAGIEPEVLERIFEPFFSTKEPGQGTGLGLAVVHGIVKAHEGAIRVETLPGEGTCFTVHLPAAPKSLQTLRAPRERGRGANERVLYVDDEAALVSLATRALERVGFRVDGFSDVERALDAFRAAPGEFDAVITDLSMPGMSGFDFARELRRIRPALPIVVTSGDRRSSDVEAARCAGMHVVAKPSLPDELASALLHALGRGPKP
jgi:PAS domain S-box-containing protein